MLAPVLEKELIDIIIIDALEFWNILYKAPGASILASRAMATNIERINEETLWFPAAKYTYQDDIQQDDIQQDDIQQDVQGQVYLSQRDFLLSNKNSLFAITSTE